MQVSAVCVHDPGGFLSSFPMTMLILLLPVLLLTIAAAIDVRSREIPDTIAVSLVLVAVSAATFGWLGIQWSMVGAGALLGCAIGYVLFRFAKFGGGDAKLIVASGAFLGPVGLLIMLFWMSLAGGVLALIAVARGERDYAYGPAIAAGYLAYLMWPVGLFSQFMS
jgi:prepilin peptidase CpaA